MPRTLCASYYESTTNDYATNLTNAPILLRDVTTSNLQRTNHSATIRYMGTLSMPVEKQPEKPQSPDRKEAFAEKGCTHALYNTLGLCAIVTKMRGVGGVGM